MFVRKFEVLSTRTLTRGSFTDLHQRTRATQSPRPRSNTKTTKGSNHHRTTSVTSTSHVNRNHADYNRPQCQPLTTTVTLRRLTGDVTRVGTGIPRVVMGVGASTRVRTRTSRRSGRQHPPRDVKSHRRSVRGRDFPPVGAWSSLLEVAWTVRGIGSSFRLSHAFQCSAVCVMRLVYSCLSFLF